MFHHWICATTERDLICTCGFWTTAEDIEAMADHLRVIFETQVIWGREWVPQPAERITTKMED